MAGGWITKAAGLFGKSIEDDPHQIAHGDAFPAPLINAISGPACAFRTFGARREDAADTCPATVEPSSGGGDFIRSGRESPAADGSALLPTSTPEFFRGVAFPQHDGGNYERS